MFIILVAVNFRMILENMLKYGLRFNPLTFLRTAVTPSGGCCLGRHRGRVGVMWEVIEPALKPARAICGLEGSACPGAALPPPHHAPPHCLLASVPAQATCLSCCAGRCWSASPWGAWASSSLPCAC